MADLNQLCNLFHVAVLRQLQEERLEKEKELKAKELDKKAEEADTQTPVEPDKGQEKSPFKFLQENFVEKVKVIAKPTVLKDKIQEKFKIEGRKDSSSKYTQEYVFEGESKDTQHDISPPGPLPPVIRLDSPDLLTVEIREPDSDISFTKVPSSERFSTLSGDSSVVDGEICTNENQSSFKRSGTGAASALARLQEDHKSEENSSPVFRGADSQTVVSIQGEEEEDSIVFNRKNKTKKKKKGNKVRKSRASELLENPEQDTVSVHSTTSVDSYHSDSSSPALQPAQAEDTEGEGKSAVGDRDLSQSDEGASARETEVNTGVECNIDVMDLAKEVTINVEGSVENKDSENVSNEETSNTVEFVEIASEIKTKDLGDISTETTDPVKDEVVDNTVVEPEHFSGMSGTAYEQYLAYSDPGASSLDKEMARLNSYLGETSERSCMEIERSTSTTGSYSTDTMMDYPKVGVYERSFKQDSANKSSKLENQLQRLDLEALSSMEVSNELSLEEPLSIGSLPSVSSLDRTPSISGEDFYSKYTAKSPGEFSPTFEDYSSDDNTKEDLDIKNSDDELKSLKIFDKGHFLKTTNTWTEITALGNIHSLCVSSTHVWITDKSLNIYYSSLFGPGIIWKKVQGSASQISVSPCGNIVWILHKNTVSAGTKVTQKRPEGMKWVVAVRDVAYICVDQTCAWLVLKYGGGHVKQLLTLYSMNNHDKINDLININ